MSVSDTMHYELERFYPGFDRQEFWELFVDHEGWSASEYLPGKIIIEQPGEGHPQGVGAVRAVVTGPATIREDIVGFRAPEYFAYATRDGSMPVNGFGGELTLEQQEDGLLVQYKGHFTPKYPGTGWLFRILLRWAQGASMSQLAKAYRAAHQGTEQGAPRLKASS